MIRRATAEDAEFIASLLDREDVEPFMSARRPRGLAEIRERIERSQREPQAFGIFVIEDDGGLAGTMEFEEGNRRSRIANLGGLALHPDFRGRGIAEEAAREFQRHLLVDLGYHRLQLEIYDFNERSIAHTERAGFTREGARRRAYRRHGEWVGSVLYAMIREDLGLPPGVDLLHEYVARHNAGVRYGDWESLGECFADDAVFELEGAAVGSFHGPDEIVAACAARAPDDEVRVVEALDDGDAVVAVYAWAASPAESAGTMRLRLASGRITALTVTVEKTR